MAEVKILVTGFTSADLSDADEEKTCPTICLVIDGDIKMVVDPGVLESQDVITDALKKEGLMIDDVNYVFITHSHLDHYRNIGMFKKAKTVEYFGIWDGASVEDFSETFSKDIKIIKTPGHDKTSLTLLVKTKDGIVAICGDVFWKENSPMDDPYALDPEELKKSRKKVLEMADWVIPGHGPLFKVNK